MSSKTQKSQHSCMVMFCSFGLKCNAMIFRIPEDACRWFLHRHGFFLLDCRCDSPEKLRTLLPRLEQELKDSGKFKDFYQFTFNFAKNPGQKGLGNGSDGL